MKSTSALYQLNRWETRLGTFGGRSYPLWLGKHANGVHNQYRHYHLRVPSVGTTPTECIRQQQHHHYSSVVDRCSYTSSLRSFSSESARQLKYVIVCNIVIVTLSLVSPANSPPKCDHVSH